MKFDDKISFPHPVVGFRNDFLLSPDFSYEITESEDGKEYVITIKVNVNNRPIDRHIQRKEAEYVCELDCRTTFYRTCVTSDKQHFNVMIPKNSVGGELNLTVTVNVTSQIKSYTNKDWNPVYNGYSFDLESGDIMAYVGSVKIHLDIMSEEHKAVGSFLHFKKGKEGDPISYYLGGHDIEVTLPKGMFEEYSRYLKGPRYTTAVMSSVVNEALIYALTQYHNHEEARWARLLSSASVLSEYDFEEEIDVLTAIDMARTILNQPHQKLFSSLVELMKSDDDE